MLVASLVAISVSSLLQHNMSLLQILEMPTVQEATDLAWGYWESAKARYEKALANGDPRVADWPLMKSPLPTLLIWFHYLVMCSAGPQLMAKFRPLELRLLMMGYNISLVILSLYMSLEMLLTTWKLGYNYFCDPLVYSTDHYSIRLASVIWLFHIAKILEVLDTLFFILRKKNSQITFLHKYHHSSMLICTWIGAKWYAGGSFIFPQLVNNFVHTIMYTYYLLSGLGPSLRPYLWWKKYITIIQMVQFVLVIIHSSQALYFGCNDEDQWVLIFYVMSHLVLFINFYIHAYYLNKKKERGNKESNEDHKRSVANGTHLLN